ncbi:MAG: hypothetical protein IPI26_00080 [Elusimicrobia bacterium]|nr:hypothetical protein [Elusimicrobiota bacterium]
MLSNTFEGFPMRRVSSLDFPLGSAFHKVLAGFLSLALVLGPASAFSYDDDRYTYTPPRVQNYQNQYRPQNNFSPSSQLNRQISNMNSVLTFKQNVGFTNPKIDLKTDQLSQDTFKPKILFQLAMANPVKAPVLGTKPLQPISIAKPGFFGAVQSIFKGIGAGFHKVGQAIGNVVQRVFTRADKPGVVSPQQREILAQFPNLQPTGPNSFVAVGKATVAFGKVWEPGSTFTAKDGNLQLNQGVSLESSFGGIKDKNGGLLPVRMANIEGAITPVGLDFDRMRPNTVLQVAHPTAVGGFGTLHPGELTYQGPVKDAAKTTIGGRFNFQGVKVDLDHDAARQFGVDPTVTIKQATFTLQAGLMRLNSALLENGDKRTFIQESKPPLDVSQFSEKLDLLANNSQTNADVLQKTEKDFFLRAQAVNAQISRLSGTDNPDATIQFGLSTDFSNAVKDSTALSQSLTKARELADNGDFHAADAILSDASVKQSAIASKINPIQTQSVALRVIEHALSNVVQNEDSKTLSPSDLAVLIQTEISKSAQSLPKGGKLFVPISEALQPPTTTPRESTSAQPPRGVISGFVRVVQNFVHGFVEAVKLPIHLGQRAALFLGKLVDHTGRTARRTQQLAAEAIFGVLSGDIFDRANAIRFDLYGPAVITINGILNSATQALEISNAVRRSFGISDATIVRNDTHYFFGDFFQIIGHETLGTIDKPAILTAMAIREGIKQKGEVYVVAHSQGTSIFRQALYLLKPEEIKKIHYLGLGPEVIINSKINGLGSSKNIFNRFDIVPVFGNFLAAPLNFVLPWRVGRLYVNEVDYRREFRFGWTHSFSYYKKRIDEWAQSQQVGR